MSWLAILALAAFGFVFAVFALKLCLLYTSDAADE